MEANNKQKALQALKNIDSVLDSVRDLFPKTTEEKKEPHKEAKLLKRVQGIITNFNEENTGRKLKSLIAFVDNIKKRYPNWPEKLGE